MAEREWRSTRVAIWPFLSRSAHCLPNEQDSIGLPVPQLFVDRDGIDNLNLRLSILDDRNLDSSHSCISFVSGRRGGNPKYLFSDKRPANTVQHCKTVIGECPFTSVQNWTARGCAYCLECGFRRRERTILAGSLGGGLTVFFLSPFLLKGPLKRNPRELVGNCRGYHKRTISAPAMLYRTEQR
jgi:hypothetical protein